MPLILNKRAHHLSEEMDDPHGDPVRLHITFHQFRRMNPLISQWHRVYKKYMRPLFDPSKINTVLDIGFGGGDILFRLSHWSKKDGFRVQITGIEIDSRTLEFVNGLPETAGHPDIQFRLAPLSSVAAENHRFDFVISNHLLHHLGQDEMKEMLKLSARLAKKRVIFNDIRRADLAWLGFGLLIRPFLTNSFSGPDGLRSIRRSYTQAELAAAVPEGWLIRRLFPYRLLLMRDS